MSEPDLIQQQRVLLRTFRQATAQRAKAETDAEACRKADGEAANTALNSARQTAAAQLAEARKAQEQVEVALTQAGLQHLLEQGKPAPPAVHPGANPAQELARSVSAAIEAPASIQASIKALQQWRIVAASRLLIGCLSLIALVILALLLLVVVGPFGYQAWRSEQLYLSLIALVVVALLILVVVGPLGYRAWRSGQLYRSADGELWLKGDITATHPLSGHKDAVSSGGLGER